MEALDQIKNNKTTIIATFSVIAIAIHLFLRFGLKMDPAWNRIPLLATLALGGTPLVYDLLIQFWNREFGSDLLGGSRLLPRFCWVSIWLVRSSC